MEAEIYSKTNCGYCDRAKLRLAKYNPKIYMLDTDYTREDFFEKFPNAKTFPQIVIEVRLKELEISHLYLHQLMFYY